MQVTLQVLTSVSWDDTYSTALQFPKDYILDESWKVLDIPSYCPMYTGYPPGHATRDHCAG